MTQTYQELIIEGLKGLPPDILAEITDFVYFVRKRTLQPHTFADELRNSLIDTELRQLSHSEELHLEQEFEAYEQRFPHE